MYTAQATYQNDEVGFGEGMSDHHASIIQNLIGHIEYQMKNRKVEA